MTNTTKTDDIALAFKHLKLFRNLVFVKGDFFLWGRKCLSCMVMLKLKMIFCWKIQSYHMTTKRLHLPKEKKNLLQKEKPWIKFQLLGWIDEFLCLLKLFRFRAYWYKWQTRTLKFLLSVNLAKESLTTRYKKLKKEEISASKNVALFLTKTLKNNTIYTFNYKSDRKDYIYVTYISFQRRNWNTNFKISK